MVLFAEYREQVRYVNTRTEYELRRYVTETPVLCPAAQWRLVRFPRVGVRAALAGNASFLPECQLLLGTDGNQYVRRSLAGNPHLTAEAGALLLENAERPLPPGPQGYVLRRLASNRAAPPEVLAALVSSLPTLDSVLGSRLFSNPAVPWSAFESIGELSRYSNYFQFVLSRRPDMTRERLRRFRLESVPEDALERFVDPPGPAVHFRPSFQGTVGEMLDLLEVLALRPPAEREVFERLYREWSGTVEELLAALPLLLRP